MSSTSGLRLLGVLVAVTLGLAIVAPAVATTYTWYGTGADANWGTVENWGGVAPSDLDTAVFDDTGVAVSPVNDVARAVDTVTFANTGGSYNLSGDPAAVLTVNTAITQVPGTGVTNTISATISTGAIALTINVADGSRRAPARSTSRTHRITLVAAYL